MVKTTVKIMMEENSSQVYSGLLTYFCHITATVITVVIKDAKIKDKIKLVAGP